MITKTTPSPEGAVQEIDLVELLGLLFDSWRVILASTVLFTLAALMYVLFATPVYQADALVQVEQKKGNALLSSLSSMLPDTAPASAPEIQLLQSRMILGETIEQLGLRNVIKPDLFPVTGPGWARLTGDVPGSVQVTELTLPRVNGVSSAAVLTVGEGDTFRVEGDGFSASGVVGHPLALHGFSVTVSGIDARPGARFTLRKLTMLEAIVALQKRFIVTERSKESGMLGLTLTGEDPVMTARILNRIADNYRRQNVDRQAEQDAKSLAFLQQKLPQVSQELNAAEDRLNAYRQQHGSVNLDLEAKSVLDRTVNADNELNALSFREAEISQLYRKDHPTYRALLEKRKTLEQEKTQLDKRISAMPSTQQEVLRLSRDVETDRTVYLQLLSRQQELDIARSSAIGNVRVIDGAMTSPLPVSPRKPLIVLFGCLFGVMAGTGLTLARMALHRGIVSPEQLEEQGINVYATVPLSEWLDRKTRLRSRRLFSGGFRHRTHDIPFLAVDNPTDLAVEAVRSLRTSLHFAMMEAANNILMISGATPDSGKTFVSSSLAAIVAGAGQRVLFIDADMRRGYAHELFCVDNARGLSDVLSGQCALQEAIQRPEKGGADVLCRGSAPPNPAELLMHSRFETVLAWASAQYDLVIVDTPPVLAVTDAVIVGQRAGTSLVVARAEVNSVKEVGVCVRRLEQGGVNIRGAVLNGVIKRSGAGSGYYHYGYGTQ